MASRASSREQKTRRSRHHDIADRMARRHAPGAKTRGQLMGNSVKAESRECQDLIHHAKRQDCSAARVYQEEPKNTAAGFTARASQAE